MGSLTGQHFISRAEKSLNFDEVIFTANELLEFLSDAQRAAVHLRPEANPVTVEVALDAGPKQRLPPEAYVLFDVIRNIPRTEITDDELALAVPGISGRAIKQRQRGDVDTEASWPHEETDTGEAVEYIYDTRERRSFYVTPPSKGTITIGTGADAG